MDLSHVGMFIVGDHTEGRRLHNLSPNLGTGCHTLCAFAHLSTLHHKKFYIYTDSYSALKALESFSSTDNPVIVDVLKLNINLTSRGYEILYCWVPGLTGIKGNELADITEKSAERYLSCHQTKDLEKMAATLGLPIL
ncbi:hypothetical protein X975_15817, partial [Stegodyphus mimosarum]